MQWAADHASGRDLLYYEDFPYAQTESVPAEELKPRCVSLTEDDLRAKLVAATCYASQIGILFGSLDLMREQVMRYAERVGEGYGLVAAERH